jgi:hypothetical protein
MLSLSTIIVKLPQNVPRGTLSLLLFLCALGLAHNHPFMSTETLLLHLRRPPVVARQHYGCTCRGCTCPWPLLLPYSAAVTWAFVLIRPICS